MVLVSVIATVGLFAQTERSDPTATIGELDNEITTVSVTWLQLPLLVDVKYRFAKPAANSAELGV